MPKMRVRGREPGEGGGQRDGRCSSERSKVRHSFASTARDKSQAQRLPLLANAQLGGRNGPALQLKAEYFPQTRKNGIAGEMLTRAETVGT